MGFCGIFIHSELVGSSTFSSNRKFSWMRAKLYSIRRPLQQLSCHATFCRGAVGALDDHRHGGAAIVRGT